MHPQEREEMDYNPQTELQNAFDQNRMEVELNDPRIGEALDRGKYVVVIGIPAFCLSTDAYIGEKLTLNSTHDTYEESKPIADSLNADFGSFEDLYACVKSPAKQVEEKSDWDNLPF